MNADKDRLYIEHILHCIARVNSYYGENDASLNDEKTHDAILRKLQIMSESCQRLSERFKDSHTAIDWGRIAGFRNILVHDYLGNIDSGIIRNVIEHELPKLQEAITP